MIDLQKIRRAAGNIEGMIHRTPVMTSGRLDKLAGNEVFLKSEHLQKTGSFKIRGAANKVGLAAKEGVTHVVTASSGNHGQAVACVAGMLSIRATIVVPEDVSPAKASAIRAYGGQIVKCGLTSAERIPEAVRIAGDDGGVFIPPYDDPEIMAGQGTAGLEILEQVPGCGAIFVPVGGGGLIAGILSAVKQTRPDVRVIGVEPDTANDTQLSLEAGRRIAIGATGTIADGLRTAIPGELTFPIVREALDDLITVTDMEIRKAMTILFEGAKQVVEPSGATALAGLLSGKTGIRGMRVSVVLSGGNVTPADYGRLLL
ncbi:threonine ammonia-lyase [Bhargavaea cecembensis]|uniref:threonine ammonia-lyase n=1 Tax=Bhargavaea cecembensis TaxID=394098 RepID=UPI00058C1999|nr:threonine/serine dehydratase [Bhargavaea cecembensis]